MVKNFNYLGKRHNLTFLLVVNWLILKDKEILELSVPEKLLKMREKFMNKTINSNLDNYEMLDDYSEVLTDSHLQKTVRGKYNVVWFSF